jgi:hypothetical protein
LRIFIYKKSIRLSIGPFHLPGNEPNVVRHATAMPATAIATTIAQAANAFSISLVIY